MTVINAIFSNFCAFLMSIILTAIPYAGIELPVINTLEDDCKLNIEIISDVHIEEKELARQLFLKAALKNISNAKTDIDALVVAGDITNYADEASLAKYYEIIGKYSPVPVVTAAGNHDIGHASDEKTSKITQLEAKANFIKYNNEYMGMQNTENHYSCEINGYKFIVLGDDCIDGHWDGVDISQDQLNFLDAELADGTKDGKPVFVVCHWPMDDVNGQDIIWPGSGIDLDENDIKSVMEKYDNVFYISGHMHAGIKSTAVDEKYGLSNVEQLNGVTYVNLPTFGIINMFGDPVSGTGMQLEVYDENVIIRPRNFITNKWYTNSVYNIDIVR